MKGRAYGKRGCTVFHLINDKKPHRSSVGRDDGWTWYLNWLASLQWLHTRHSLSLFPSREGGGSAPLVAMYKCDYFNPG